MAEKKGGTEEDAITAFPSKYQVYPIPRKTANTLSRFIHKPLAKGDLLGCLPGSLQSNSNFRG
jgi:hypothetical protein